MYNPNCLICRGAGQILVRLPEKFLPLVTDLGCKPHPDILTHGYPLDCACVWKQPAGKDFGDQFQLHAQYDVTAVLLGVASDQQWFNCLSSCEDGYMSEQSDQFAEAHGLSTEFAPY